MLMNAGATSAIQGAFLAAATPSSQDPRHSWGRHRPSLGTLTSMRFVGTETIRAVSICSRGRLALCMAAFLAVSQLSLSQNVASGRDTQVPDTIHFTSADKRPTKVVKPGYPEAAKRAGIKGPVVVDIIIGKTGEVEWAQAITGPKELWPSATEAVKQWKWEPFLLNEKPVRVRTKAVVNFVLETRGSHKKEVRGK
jgi:TonB family protein